MLKKAFIGAFCALFVLAASLAAQDTLLHSFAGQPSDGSEPFGSLVCGGKTLYGLTLWGGANNEGTIFKINKDGTGFALLHSFADDVSNGFYALGTLLLKGKILYGVTMQGGAYDKGVLFKINTDGTGFAILHSFAGGEGDGHAPVGGLVAKGQNLYGMTDWGGTSGRGTIYTIKTNGTGFQVLHSFLGGTEDGGLPQRGTLALKGSVLYGMTMGYGDSNKGIIFKINTNGTGYNLLHSFTGAADGEGPFGSLLLKGNAMYGLVCRGGINGEGVIFKANLDGTGFLVLHHFSTAAGDGARPYGGLIAKGTVLYGMTSEGGQSHKGALFTYDLKTNAFVVIYSFYGNAARGSYPQGTLILKNNILYGMTLSGGVSDLGTVFSYSTK